MSEQSESAVEQSLRSTIHWKEQSESFLLGVIVGGALVLSIELGREVVR